jgi:hypothetical protein
MINVNVLISALPIGSIVIVTRPCRASFQLLSCRSCRPNAPFAELVRLSRTSIADEMREEHRRRVLGE